MSTPKKSTEAEDVLEFLNSLPENKDKSSAFKAKSNKKDGKEDVLDFLDELEKSDLRKKEKKNEKKQEKEETPEVKEEVNEVKETVKEEKEKEKEKEKEEEEEEFIDPIASISNWWSSSGSNAVNSLWNNAKSIQQKATEEASKLTEATKKFQEENLDNEKFKSSLNFISKNFESILNNLNDEYDEFLKIYLIHDLINFDSLLNQLIQANFKKVLKQVQGDIFIEIIKQNTLNEKVQRRYSIGNHDTVRQLNLFQGSIQDGDKLNWANLNSSIKSFEELNKSSEIEKNLNISNIFISILPVETVSKAQSEEFISIDSNSSNTFKFRIILKDINHKISLISETQSFPIQWAKWMQYDKSDGKDEEKLQDEDIDPSEWVSTWVDQGLNLTIGTLAQEYVIKRMGF